MNNDQQPNISPDYNYIISQQVPEAGKKGPDKRIVFIVVAVVLLGIIGLLSLLLAPSDSKKESGVTGPAAQVVTNLNDALKEKEYTRAAGITGWQLTDESRAILASQFEKTAKVVDYNSCVIEDVQAKSEAQIVVQTCPTFDKQSKITFSYSVVALGDTYRIASNEYTVATND